MKVLLDHNVPHWVRGRLAGHEGHTARWAGLAKLGNGELLAACASAAYDVFLSIDKKLEYEHNLGRLPVTVVVLDVPRITRANLEATLPAVLKLLSNPLDRAFYAIQSDGTVLRLDEPRRRP